MDLAEVVANIGDWRLSDQTERMTTRPHHPARCKSRDCEACDAVAEDRCDRATGRTAGLIR